MTYSEFMQVLLGFLILRYLKGRRITIYQCILLILAIIEIVNVILLSTGTKPGFFFDMIHGQLVFTLYYTLCILGPLEIAKSELLLKNLKLGGYLLCLMTGI